MNLPTRLDALTTFELKDALERAPSIALLPVGSVEPHGPHLPLATDSVISEEASERACALLRERGLSAFLAPTIPYGVTDYAAGFVGAMSIAEDTLVAFVGSVVDGLLAAGFQHVSLVNNHLEPAQDRAIRRVAETRATGSVSVACPLTRRWGRTMGDEFKSGACHAGEYETSLMLAARASERSAVRPHDALPSLSISLSQAIRDGKATFREIGMDHAYTGAPARATKEEGDVLYEKLAKMIVTEVLEALDLSPRP